MSEVPLGSAYMYPDLAACVQGYLTNKKQPPPLGPPKGPRLSPTEGS